MNLSVEKREKLLSAAVREFTERPYNEVSINRIIQAAGIPRGSFYMYFHDKEELFRYLLRESLLQMLTVFEEILRSRDGDVFAAMPDMYDRLQSRTGDETELDSLSVLSAVVNCNCGLQKGNLLELIDLDVVMDHMAKNVNTDLLDLRSEEELECILRMLLALTIPLIYNGLCPGGDPDGRKKLSLVLEILRRGMGVKPAADDGK